MKIKQTLLSVLIAFIGLSSFNAHAQKKMNMNKMDMDKMMPDIKTWPEASRMAAMAMMNKYGKPDATGPEMLAWKDKGPWKMIQIDKQDTKHSFPVEHTDMMTQTIKYEVPTGKYDDLAKFDGSVIVNRTQGYLSARCDLEANNFLALNLANDVVTGKKTVEEARKAYADIIKEKMNGGNPEYMEKLTFMQKGNGDPDINTTGLNKEEVMMAIKAHKK